MNLRITSKTRILDVGSKTHFSERKPANLTYLPSSTTLHLSQREIAMIERLIDICICFEDRGQSELSEIVDRIGLKMTQAFLSRVPAPASAV